MSHTTNTGGVLMRVPYLPPTLRTAAALLAMSGLATSQTSVNLIQNGDFEVSKTSIAPWTIISPSEVTNPRIVSDDMVGFGRDNAFAGRFTGYACIEQTFRVSGEQTRFPIMVSLAIRDGHSEAWPAAIQVDNITANHRLYCNHAPLVVVFPPLSDGAHTLRVYPTRERDAQIDDIVVRPVRDPHIRLTSFCTGPNNTVWEVRGDRRVVHAMYVSLQRLEPGVRIPGFEGLLELDPVRDGGLFFVAAAVSDLTVLIPRQHLVTLGRTLYAQAISVNPLLNVLQLGSRTAWREWP
jgi:hypothetical protein